MFDLYNAWGEKNSYGRLIQGLLRSSFVIDAEGVIRKVFRRLNTKINANQLIEAYRALSFREAGAAADDPRSRRHGTRP